MGVGGAELQVEVVDVAGERVAVENVG